MTPEHAARPLRAVLLGVAAVVLGLSAHDAAGGAPTVAHAPLLLGVGLGAAAVTVLADLLGGVRRTAGALGAFVALGAGQVVLHLATGASAGGTAGHAMAGMSSATHTAHLLSPAMLTAHVLVTLAVTAGIAGAQASTAVVATLGRAVVDLARRVRRASPPVAPPPRRPAAVLVPGHAAEGAPGIVLTRIHPRRGPPLPS